MPVAVLNARQKAAMDSVCTREVWSYRARDARRDERRLKRRTGSEPMT